MMEKSKLSEFIAAEFDCAQNQLNLEDFNLLFSQLQKYCRLSKIVLPTDAELDELAEILDAAQDDPRLSCLLNEADHLIAYELGLTTDCPNQDQSGVKRMLSHSVGVRE